MTQYVPVPKDSHLDVFWKTYSWKKLFLTEKYFLANLTKFLRTLFFKNSAVLPNPTPSITGPRVSSFFIMISVTLSIISVIHLLIFLMILKLIKFNCLLDKNKRVFSATKAKNKEQIIKQTVVKKETCLI